MVAMLVSVSAGLPLRETSTLSSSSVQSGDVGSALETVEDSVVTVALRGVDAGVARTLPRRLAPSCPGDGRAQTTDSDNHVGASGASYMNVRISMRANAHDAMD